MKLQRTIAIVTGAAHGIGRAIARALSAEGAAVLIADVDEAGEDLAAEIRKVGRPASFVRVDVADEAACARCVQMAAAARGKIDVLVNNAAYLADLNDVLTDSPEQWQKCLDVTLTGAARMIRLVLPHMVPHRAGSIINVASVQGLVAGRSTAAYTAAKHGLIGLTRSFSMDFGPHNVRCNAICPGAIRTRISPPEGSELHQRQIGKTMLGRTGEPEEVAGAAVWLASEESSYVTGAVIPVDGGWTAM
jgi:NAD(P)-dependent dehydrogenase (short-subunit alcohol dehydrogenase family)